MYARSVNRALAFESLSDRSMLSAVNLFAHEFSEFDVPVVGVFDTGGDGDLDVYAAVPGGSVVFFENVGGEEPFVRREFGVDPSLSVGIRAVGDVDGDFSAEMMTFVGALIGLEDGKYDELGRMGTVDDGYFVGAGVFEDVDGDQDVDFLFVGEGLLGGQLWWGENVNGSVTDELSQIGEISCQVCGSGAGAFLVDLNGDGIRDAVGQTWGVVTELDAPGNVVWFRGLGSGEFDEGRFIFAEGEFTGLAGTVEIAFGDMDGDGDVDLVRSGDALRVYDNDGDGAFSDGWDWELRGRVASGGLVDVDLDGDLDVIGTLAKCENTGGMCAAWHENVEGVFVTREFGDVRSLSALVLDVDNDGDADFMSDSIWYESNAATIRSDLNEDGVVAFSDFLVFSSNFGRDDKILAPQDGDINGDGSINFDDFLIFSANFGKTT